MNFGKILNIKTQGFCDIINITGQVQKVIDESKIKTGVVCVFIQGSTCAITTLEYEPNLIKDFQELMERLIPQNKPTHHGNTWGDDNGFSHLRASLIGPSLCVPLKDGKMVLGAWQQIVACDFDNRRRERKIFIQIIS